MHHTKGPTSRVHRRGIVTKPVTIRMDVDLLERLVVEAPLQRRSVANLLQQLVADGLDRLADERAARQVQVNYRQLLADLDPRELRAILARQEAVLARRQGKRARLPPLPPSMRLRRNTRQPDTT